jgi:hypothetical protein
LEKYGNKYPYSVVEEYKYRTNSPYLRILMLAAGGSTINEERFEQLWEMSQAGHYLIQLIDDMVDFGQDNDANIGAGQVNIARGALNSGLQRFLSTLGIESAFPH